MMELTNLVDVPSLEIERGRIVGKSVEDAPHYDVMDQNGVIHVNLAGARLQHCVNDTTRPKA